MISIRRVGRWNGKMQRVDAGYLYEIGDAVRSIGSLIWRDTPAFEAWGPLTNCRQKLGEFLANSVYVDSIRGVLHPPALLFLTAIDSLTQRMLNEKMETLGGLDVAAVRQAYLKFEPIFQAELSGQVVYLVQPKGVFDVIRLVEQGSKLFPPDVAAKAPEALRDIEEGAKAIAFELWTAGAFHFHRANEAVLRRYFDLCAGQNNKPKMCIMGTMLAKLIELKKGDQQIIDALNNIKKFHRNPTSHPGEFVQEAEEAFSLIAVVRGAMGYMLACLPVVNYLGSEVALVPTFDDPAPPLIPVDV